MARSNLKAEGAIRVRAEAGPDAEALRATAYRRGNELGLLGWVRLDEGSGAVLAHAEGQSEAIDTFVEFLEGEASNGEAETVEVDSVKPEGHEQFAIRGIDAGVFVVQEHQATAHHFDLRLEVEGVMRSWAVPKEPSMDPAVKRMAIEVGDHSIEHNTFEGETSIGWVKIWDRGAYEQGGRVPWPEALERGHAVFVLHGERLSGGFALQRTHDGDKPQWLLIKRRDDESRHGDT